MNKAFQEDWEALSEIQRDAAKWNEGSIVVLAGPGSGKTRVLTCHIAYLLEQSPEQKFRILGLTFTNKAADEMRSRVQKYIPNQERRLFLNTFHSFCADVLRQHGAHLHINPNFHIYSQESDLQSVLDDAVDYAQTNNENITDDLRKALPVINRLKSRLIFPNEAKDAFSEKSLGEKFAAVYEAYERELTRRNALDFNSLILKAYELFKKHPAFAERYQRVYKYICIDEFQDTNLAQYQLIRSLTGDVYKNVFVVADDDQIIYQWNGASHQRIQEFVEHYQPKLIQLPVNYRCPPEVVNIANKLISHNFRRTPNKATLEAFRASSGDNVVRLLSGFEDAESEAKAVAKDIKKYHAKNLNKVTLLARNRKLLALMESSLRAVQIKCRVHQRRDNFESTPFRLLIAVLSLTDDRQDRKNLTVLCGTYSQVGGSKVEPELVEAQANLSNRDLLQQWHKFASEKPATNWERSFIDLVQKHLITALDYQRFINLFLKSIDDLSNELDGIEHEKFYRYTEEKEIWNNLARDIKSAIGSAPTLGAFLHELQMRPKDPIIPADTVSLMTIHSAKGKEFNHVYLIGSVEGELPSFQSLQKGNDSLEVEEERRNCFVAITRTEDTLTLSYADSYRGWSKQPSRFLYEMDLLE
jgi:DNA helicase-2/ATP-dependent DNA helicase PcrA